MSDDEFHVRWSMQKGFLGLVFGVGCQMGLILEFLQSCNLGQSYTELPKVI